MLSMASFHHLALVVTEQGTMRPVKFTTPAHRWVIPLTSCTGGRHNMPPPLWPFDLQNGVRVTYDVGYLCANFILPRPLCSRLRPDVRDRQTSDSIIA